MLRLIFYAINGNRNAIVPTAVLSGPTTQSKHPMPVKLSCLKMLIHAHFFRREILTGKVGQTEHSFWCTMMVYL